MDGVRPKIFAWATAETPSCLVKSAVKSGSVGRHSYPLVNVEIAIEIVDLPSGELRVCY